MPATSPCGLGGPTTSTGPCTGVINPSDAGSGVFSGLSSASAVSAIIAAGAIIAGLFFAVWAVRKVGRFFDAKRANARALEPQPGTMEWDDNFWAERGREDRASRGDADFGDLSDAEDDTEDDMEDDTAELEYAVQRIGHDA